MKQLFIFTDQYLNDDKSGWVDEDVTLFMSEQCILLCIERVLNDEAVHGWNATVLVFVIYYLFINY
jgi:hypothetical protein